DADLSLDVVVGSVQVLGKLRRPPCQVDGGQARGPPTPVERAPSDAVGKAGEGLVAVPGQTPRRRAVRDLALRARLLAVDGRAHGAAGAEADVGQVLDVLGDEEATSVEDKDTARLSTLAEDLLGTVGAEHPGADHHCVEGKPAVPYRHDRLVPGVADVSSLDVDHEGRFLQGWRPELQSVVESSDTSPSVI